MAIHKMHIGQDQTAPSDTDVQTALGKILDSEEFRRSKRLGDFLRFVVEEELAGRGDRLKAFTIAREVYGRDEHFDPRTDTVVRVDAGRLRSRLASYYESEGSDDPVCIDVPKGGYSPMFCWRSGDPSNVESQAIPATAPSRRSRRSAMRLGVLVLILLTVMFGLHLLKSDRVADKTGPAPASDSIEKTPGIFLVVLPFMTLSDDMLETRLSSGLQEAVITDMAKLSGLSVMAHTSLMNMDPRSTELDNLEEEYGVTHVLRGTLEHEGELVRINVQLIDINKGSTIWAERLDSEINDLLKLQDVISKQIINYLTIHTSSDEIALLKHNHAKNPEALALYRQALVLLMPPNELERIITARHMFQRVIELDPMFGGGYAGLGFTHSASVLFLKAEKPEIELEKAINLALKAIETDPEFGMGHASLAFAYANSGRHDEALSSARLAIALQPGDAFTQFIYGNCLARSGFPSEAVPFLSEAIRLDPLEPRTPYRNVLGLAYFSTGEYARAIEQFDANQKLEGPSGPHMDFFRASAYAELGQVEMAKSIVSELKESAPEFPFQKWLTRWVHNSDDQERLMNNLRRLGLPEA